MEKTIREWIGHGIVKNARAWQLHIVDCFPLRCQMQNPFRSVISVEGCGMSYSCQKQQLEVDLKNMLNYDDEVQPVKITISLTCPLSLAR